MKCEEGKKDKKKDENFARRKKFIWGQVTVGGENHVCGGNIRVLAGDSLGGLHITCNLLYTSISHKEKIGREQERHGWEGNLYWYQL